MLLARHERLLPVNRGAGVLKGGRDYAKRQQRRQPDRQLVGRNELDDGSGSDRTGPCMAIRLVTRTRALPTGWFIALER